MISGFYFRRRNPFRLLFAAAAPEMPARELLPETASVKADRLAIERGENEGMVFTLDKRVFADATEQGWGTHAIDDR
ncbi:MAG: hypothetical protein V2I25_02735 [Woeseiaceae bacterium]|jgi:hypothetical protein|nr:hypothetical protein [Woeseiaceae bacterium]